MSAAHKRRGTRPPVAGVPWKPEEEALLGTMPDKEVATRIHRTESAVSCMRFARGVPAFHKRKPRLKPIVWTQAKDALLGTMEDRKLARKLRCTAVSVFNRRGK